MREGGVICGKSVWPEDLVVQLLAKLPKRFGLLVHFYCLFFKGPGEEFLPRVMQVDCRVSSRTSIAMDPKDGLYIVVEGHTAFFTSKSCVQLTFG